MDEQEKHDDTFRLAWAIVVSGARRLVGKVLAGTEVGDVAEMKQAVELDVSVTRLPAGPQGQIANLAAPVMVPIDSEEDAVDIKVLVHSVRYFDDMADKGARYTRMYGDLQGQLLQMRARRLNIEPAREMPRPGGFGPGGLVGR